MSIKNKICEYCKAQLILLENGQYKCEACGALFEEDKISEEETILLNNAHQDLRIGKFDDAYEKFSDIISKYPNNYEAYWGICLCNHGVIFVDDIKEDKKVPTCYNMEIRSFLEDPNYIKTIELCPESLKGNYELLANKIEIIRKEWIAEASKIKPYDVFISFKHTVDGKTTSDYDYLNDLWHILTYDYKLNVFFSPKTLSGKASEQYEPYIYRALHTSKVMLLYGEKPEYFESTWVKNEWTRYLRKIKTGEKDPKSLIVAYQNFDAYLLPRELKSLQALDANKPLFVSSLLENINNILSKSEGIEKLERVEIKSGQIAKKSRVIGNETIAKREIGAGYVTTKDASNANIINIVKSLIDSGRFDIASNQLERVLNSEPNNSEALYLKFLIENKIKGTADLKVNVYNLLPKLENLINTSEKQIALSIIDVIKDALLNELNIQQYNFDILSNSQHEENIYSLYSLLSNYNYKDKKTVNEKVLVYSTSTYVSLKLFNIALKELEENQIDEYIKYLLTLVDNLTKYSLIDSNYFEQVNNIKIQVINQAKIYYLSKILEVDEGNEQALEKIFALTNNIKYVEQALRFSNNDDDRDNLIMSIIKKSISNPFVPFMDLVKFIPPSKQMEYIRCLKDRYFSLNQVNKDRVINKEKTIIELKWITKQLMLEEEPTSERTFALFKYDLGCISDNDLVEYSLPLESLDSFNDVLPQLDDMTREKLLKIVDKQKQYKEQKLREIKKQEENKKEEERKKQIIKSLEKKYNVSMISTIILSIICLGFISYYTYTYCIEYLLHNNWSYEYDIKNFLFFFVVFILLGVNITIFLYLSKRSIGKRNIFAKINSRIFTIFIVIFSIFVFTSDVGMDFLEGDLDDFFGIGLIILLVGLSIITILFINFSNNINRFEKIISIISFIINLMTLVLGCSISCNGGCDYYTAISNIYLLLI